MRATESARKSRAGGAAASAAGAVGLALLAGLACYGCSGSGAAGAEAGRVDVIAMGSISGFGTLERATVEFPHDLHTQRTGLRSEDCTTCHLRDEDGVISMRFMNTAAFSGPELREIYHDRCIGCHRQMNEEEEVSGPLICGECHRREPAYETSVIPAGMDRALHYHHVETFKSDCKPCHGSFEDGDLVTWRDRYAQETAASRPPLSRAAHERCVACHLERGGEAPLACGRCHQRGPRTPLAVEGALPRLKAGQPDFALLSAPEEGPGHGTMRMVPFPHAAHEDSISTCRACHHMTLRKCDRCHTLEGDEAGEKIRLERAMHYMGSGHSCVGCHDGEKNGADCAGCHDMMEQGRLSTHACTICHLGPTPDGAAAARSRYRAMDDFRPRPADTRLTFARADIPDTVTIDVMSEKYDPVAMPHWRHLERVSRVIRESKIATHFHGTEDVACQGCHHHTPVGEKPPLCESCHGEPFGEEDMMKPGLYGAYHRQCLGCHRTMDKAGPAECAGCHRSRGEVAAGGQAPPAVSPE